MTVRLISTTGLNMIAAFEGLRLTAYQDQRGVYTIGYGHTPAYKGQVITQAQADEFLDQDISIAEMTVSCVAGTCTDNQYAAMVSLTFNIGTGGFRTSSVLRDHLAGNFAAAGAAFLLWDKVTIDGRLVESNGLLDRRKIEMALYLNETQDSPATSSVVA